MFFSSIEGEHELENWTREVVGIISYVVSFMNIWHKISSGLPVISVWTKKIYKNRKLMTVPNGNVFQQNSWHTDVSDQIQIRVF